MKVNKLVLSLVSLFSLVSFSSCDGKSPILEKESKIAFDVSEKNMYFGDTDSLSAIYEPEIGKEITWKSDNESVVKVDDGSLEAVGIGSGIVTAHYDGDVASCLINVTMGSYAPSLIIDNVFDDEINLAIGDRFSIDGHVLYNQKEYKCDLELNVSDDEIIEVNSYGQLVAKKTGECELTVKGIWKDFNNALLTKKLHVTVVDNLVLYTFVTIGGVTKITNDVSLSIVNEFENKSYYTSALIEPFCLFNGEKKEVQLYVSDTSIISLDAEKCIISAKNVGETLLIASFTDENEKTYSSNVAVKVTSPIEIYDKEVVELCTEENFPVAQYFGVDARILEAKQGDNDLVVKRGKFIEGIEAKGSDTKPITVITNKGGYVFTNLYVYDRILTASNIFDSLLLSNGKIIKKYFILDSDIAFANMTSQNESYYASNALTDKYFAGTLDGRGHTLNVKVALNGLFGGFGEEATVKNIHLHFIFKEPNPGQNCSGLARNASTYIQSKFVVYLDNIYITAENIVERCYPIYDCKLNNTQMNNVYVNLTDSGTENLPEYVDSKQQLGCLYHLDTVLMNGPSSCFSGTVRNTYVVSGTEKFMPLGDSLEADDRIYVTYAKNDAENIGNMGHHQATLSDTGYCIGKYIEDEDNKAYFGNIPGNTNGGAAVLWLYEAQNNRKEWGIYRYNSIQSLKNSGINKIGDWVVK